MTTPRLPETIQWVGGTDGFLRLLDQTRLPLEETYLDCRDVPAVHDAIQRLVVRGAPAIGVAAAYGVCVAVARAADDDRGTRQAAIEATESLATSRPTAVNLFWALDRMRRRIDSLDDAALSEGLLTEARQIHEEDRQMCWQIGQHGAALLPDQANVLTHCNAGSLATSQWGTALSVIYAAAAGGKQIRVYADETRPLLQGARLTAWELQRSGIDVTVLCDSMSAALMRQQRIDAVVVGADRIASNGDVANKIGTYLLALAAAYHEVPFYVAAPSNTFDLSLADGSVIPIEQRAADEVAKPFGTQTVADGIQVYNPAFDVTPAKLVTALITELGVIDAVDAPHIAQHLAGENSSLPSPT